MASTAARLVGAAFDGSIPVRRYLCRCCKRTVLLLPEFALPYVRQWSGKAEVDFHTAERLLCDEQPIRESIAFHCRQAVEKHLKALLVVRQIEFPKTHSIAQLLDLIAGFAPAASGADGLCPRR